MKLSTVKRLLSMMSVNKHTVMSYFVLYCFFLSSIYPAYEVSVCCFVISIPLLKITNYFISDFPLI